MNKKVTIYDIAREAGVSTATVTRVFRKDPRVKEATRLKVQKVIDAYAYTPSVSAQHLEGGRSGTLAVVLPVVSNLYFNRIFDAAYWEAEANGCSLRLFQTMENQAISPDIVSELIRCRMDGVLFAGSIWSADRGDLNTALEKLGKYMPVATICPPDVQLDCICIQSDLVNCSRLPVRHLHTLGHRRIAFIHGEMTSVTQKRLASFKKTCAALGLEIPPEYVRPAVFHDPRSSGLQTRALLALPKRPTCILYPDDLSFLGGMSELERHGLSIPGDISVAGYDGIPLSQILRPRLSTYRQAGEEMGREAARLLIEQIEQPDVWLPQQITVAGELLPGDTVANIG